MFNIYYPFTHTDHNVPVHVTQVIMMNNRLKDDHLIMIIIMILINDVQCIPSLSLVMTMRTNEIV